MDTNSLLNTNIIFRGISKLDVAYLVKSLRSFFLPYRDSLFLPYGCTFGIEIEYEDVDKRLVDNLIKDFKGWRSVTDETLQSGGEIVTSRLHDEKRVWQNLRIACQYLKMHNANTCHNASVHVHVGSHILKNNDCWRRFFKLYAAYERVLIRFAFGDKINARNTFKQYASPVALAILETKDDINDINYLSTIKKEASYLKGNKCVALNIRGTENCNIEGNTVEFRPFNATVQMPVIQNDVNISAKMMLAAANPNLDEAFLDAKLTDLENKHYSFSEYLEECDRVFIDDALEFADIVFNNDLDKMCFFKQYFKNFESLNLKTVETVFARSMIR